MKPWRIRLRDAAPRSFDPALVARLDREDTAHFRAIEVFGNDPDAAKWMLGSTDLFGGWRSPESVAADSDAGLQSVLAQLDSMRATATPRPDPSPAPTRSRRRAPPPR